MKIVQAHTYLIFNLYCEASGQSPNLDKSTIVFSNNTTLEVKDEVCQILGIPVAADQGKYLGIPNVWGKTKNHALSYI